MTKDIRLDMCLNFDQVWKAAWSSPKKVLNRVVDTMCPSVVLKGKREKLWHELQSLQAAHSASTQWEAKRRRIKGL